MLNIVNIEVIKIKSSKVHRDREKFNDKSNQKSRRILNECKASSAAAAMHLNGKPRTEKPKKQNQKNKTKTKKPKTKNQKLTQTKVEVEAEHRKKASQNLLAN